MLGINKFLIDSAVSVFDKLNYKKSVKIKDT